MHTDEEAILIGVSGTDIVRLKMSANSLKTVYRSNQLISSLDFDVKQRRLMWLEDRSNKIYSYQIHSKANAITLSAKSVLVDGLMSIAIFAYNWITESIIWCSKTKRTVYVTSLDGAQYALLQLPTSLEPSSVAVDPFRQ